MNRYGIGCIYGHICYHLVYMRVYLHIWSRDCCLPDPLILEKLGRHVYLHLRRMGGWIVDKWRRIMIVMRRGRRYLNLELVIASVLRRRFSGNWRWRIRQPDQLSN